MLDRKGYSFSVVTAVLMGALLLAGPGSAQQTSDVSALQDDLRATEIAFAKTMADRDFEAFQKFISEEALFFTSQGELRGKQAVLDGWSRFFEGEAPPFSWKPSTVAVLASGSLGITSGPVVSPQGERIGTFSTVWRRAAGGAWQVAIDRGCGAAGCP